MAEIMGGGLNEFPFFRFGDDKMSLGFEQRLQSPDLEPRLKDPGNWPEGLKAEYGDDHGASSARAHRDRVGAAFRALRKAVDDFNPDFVLIWSKEQLENFAEDCMPPFCIYAYEELVLKPHARYPADVFPTIWGEGPETTINVPGHRAAAKHLTTKLLEQDFDMAYAYNPLHMDCLAHTFEGLLTHLDWDRKGFPYPVVPFYVNAYGHWHLTGKGFSEEGELDPPAPSARRCYELGRATARILRESPWRVAIIAGSSWSHANRNPKNSFLYPDIPGDRTLFDSLKSANYRAWRELQLEDLIHNGRQEVLSWACLAGALEELQLKPSFLDFAETWIFNSTKVTAVFQ